jgi:hypothetical protein
MSKIVMESERSQRMARAGSFSVIFFCDESGYQKRFMKNVQQMLTQIQLMTRKF